MELKISPREKEVLLLVADGKTATEIGLKLKISVFTARNHIRLIRAKLGAKSASHAVGIAKDEKLI
jgi:DNA-binding CsgD family transcriptional regulator